MKTRLLLLAALFGLSFSAFVFADMKPEKMQMLRHANPMPNLMQVVFKKADELDLTEEQSKALKAWHGKNRPRVMKLVKQVHELEKKLAQEALEGASGAVLQQITNQIFQARQGIIETKLACRNHLRDVLKPEQWDKVVELYKASHK